MVIYFVALSSWKFIRQNRQSTWHFGTLSFLQRKNDYFLYAHEPLFSLLYLQAVAAEAIQTVLRREGYPKPYEALKELTRTNEKITADSIASFIDTLNVNDDIKAELKQITPFNFTGVELF